MTYEAAIAPLGEDAQLILEIAVKFLGDYFDHEESDARNLIASLLEKLPDMYDEDFVHAESAYGVAAGAHFFCALGGKRSDFRDWMLKTGHSSTPPEALAYFRATYFKS